MTTHKLIGLLGMCRRAGRLTVGFDAVAALCRQPEVLLMITADASPRTVRQLTFHAEDKRVYALPITRDEAAHAVGSSKPVAVLATTDNGFIKALRPVLDSLEEEESQYDD